ncbi:hypothetical protein RclHR1_01090008 [Rhizophagus clarus]|uniref:CSC1/OSCA1-like 7TM region domain-containing protein n=1 Tax=Rhizophagus clarus TaxID=94130 RepID=A0A2Z6QEX8_9GLOM|nr:hypothetical protein RclHR1_01090008 [Rhizophagus clarus]
MATIETAYYSSTYLGLATQLGISTSISVYCLLQFEWNRRKKSMQYLYTPRTRLAKNASPQIPPGLFSWIRATIFLKDDFYFNNVGLDALMHIKFLKMAFQFVLFNAVIVGSILMPINYTASNIREKEVPRLSLSNIDPLNITILWAHVVCTYIVSISWMYLLYINYYEYMKLHQQHLLNKVLNGSITERTVMISRIPQDLRSEEKLQDFISKLGLGEVESARMVRLTGKLDRRIARRESALMSLEKAHIQLAKNVYYAIKRRRLLGTGFWARLFGYNNDINSFNLETGEGRDNQRIHNLVDRLDIRKRRRTNTNESTSENKNENVIRHSKLPTSGTFSSNDLMDREDGYGRQFLIWNALRHISKNVLDKYQPTHRKGFFGEKEISIDTFLKKFNYLDRRIAELRSKSIQEPPYKVTSTGFVTFKNHISAQLCAQSIMSSIPHTCTTKMAPEPRDILWDNLTKNFKEKLVRYIFVNACVWALIIFWLFPIIAFLTLTTIDSLSSKIKFLGPFLETTPIIRTLLQNVLPTVLVTFFMSFLPWILMELSKQEAFPSYSELEKAVLTRYYYFCIFNVFIVFLLGSTFLSSIFDVLRQPTSILEVLAYALPRGATFFISYVIFNTCTHGLELVQVGSQLFLHIILTSRLIATTPRMLQRVTHPWSFPYYYYYPNHILVFVITVTYSVINPLILVFSVLYYGFALIVFKHQFAYCYVRRYEAGGKFYRRVFRYTTDGLIIFQLTIIGVIWLRKGIATGALLIPLLIGTGYFKYYCYKTFYSRTHYLALDSRLRIQNRQQDEQSSQDDQRIIIVNENESTIPSNLPESPHTEKTKIESDTVIEGETSTNNNKNGDILSEKLHTKNGYNEEKNSIESDTSTKIALKTNGIIVKDNVENYSQNDDSKKSQNSIEIVRTSTEKSRSSSEKFHNIQETDSVSTSEQNEGSVIIKVNHLSSATSDTLINSAYNSSNYNISNKLLIVSSIEETENNNNDNNHDNNSSSSKKAHIKFKKGNNKLTIVPPENGINFLDKPITASPIESLNGHAQRLPSAGNLRSLHPAHFTHDPNFKVLQDETSTYQTYTHPNLIKALNRKLWLPRNPLKKICLEDNVELSKALTSSNGGNGLVGYWGDNSQYLGEAKVSAYGNHEFPSKLFHVRVREPTNERREGEGEEGEEGERRNTRYENQNTDDEYDIEESEISYNPLSPEDDHLNEFTASDELSSGEEY